MSFVTCTRRLEFDAAHRVMEHEGKCKHVHGHRYAIEVTFIAESADTPLDTLGRVIDFGVIKSVLKEWVDANWDHATILWDRDKPLGEAVANITGQKIFYLSMNPTAENMALYLFEHVVPKLFAGHGVTCTHIRLYETPNGYVDVGSSDA